MTIAEVREKCKSLAGRIPRDVLLLGIVALASSLSFGLGYSAGLDAAPPGKSPLEIAPIAATGVPAGPGSVVASKSGTKYYLPSCAGAERISDANKIWFVSAAAAAAAGYAPAAHCKGL